MKLTLNMSSLTLFTAVFTTTLSSSKQCPMDMSSDVSKQLHIYVVNTAESIGILKVEEVAPGVFALLVDSSKKVPAQVVFEPSPLVDGVALETIIVQAANNDASPVVTGSLVDVTKTTKRSSGSDSADGAKAEKLETEKTVVQEKQAKFHVKQQPTGVLPGTSDKVVMRFDIDTESSESSDGKVLAQVEVSMEGCCKVGGWNMQECSDGTVERQNICQRD